MHRPDHDHRRFAAQLQVYVPRNARGTLDDGVVQVLERIGPLLEVEDVELQGVVPRLNDLAVEAAVEGRMRVDTDVHDPEAVVEQTLEGGFGVADVTRCSLRQAPAPQGTPVLEYG